MYVRGGPGEEGKTKSKFRGIETENMRVAKSIKRKMSQ